MAKYEYKTKTTANPRSKKGEPYFRAYKNIDQSPFETDAQYYKRLAKVADERLLRLEQLSEKPNFRNVKEWAYSNAMYDLSQLFGPGVNRFNVKLPKTKAGAVDQRSYYARINAIKRFLESPTSTEGNIKAVYMLRADTINKTYGTNLTWENLATAFDTQLFTKTEKIFGSKTALRVIAKIQGKDKSKAAEKIKEAAKSIDGRTIRSAAGKAKAREKIMAQYGLTEADLYPST